MTLSHRAASIRRLIGVGLALALILAMTSPAPAQTYDFGDAPDATAPAKRYPTLYANGGARHTIDATRPHLGVTAPDAETDGQPNSTATGDGNDEDGITFTTSLITNEDATLEVVMTLGTNTSITTAYLDGWIDFNVDDDWTDTNEHIIDKRAIEAGTTSISFSVPAGASKGTTFARFRLSTDSAGLASCNDDATDGEVEDYQVQILGLDFGDAPDPNYPTLLPSGARHAVTGTAPYLGSVAPDVDADGQPTNGADGDDTDGTDDEDGVVFPSDLVPGQSATVEVTPTGAGKLDAWIDFNNDGDWDDTGEQIFSSQSLSGSSPQELTFAVPSDAVSNTTTFARFRYSTAGGLAPTGLAQDGEVEDLTVDIAPVADLGVAISADSTSVTPGRTRITYTLTVSNGGPSAVSGAHVSLPFDADLIAVFWSCEISGGSGSCGKAGGAADVDLDLDLDDGAQATILARAWVSGDAAGQSCSGGRCLELSAAVAPPSGTLDLNTVNNTAVDSALIQPEGDLMTFKDDGLTRAGPGDLGAYAIIFVNAGPSTAEQVTVTDAFPTDKIEADPSQCTPGPDPCWTCRPAPSLGNVEVQVEGQGSPPVSGLEGSTASAVSPDGKFVYVAGAIDDAVVVFSSDLTNLGSLTFVEKQQDNVGGVDGLDGADALAISPDGKHLYVAGADDNAVALFERNASTGALSFVEAYVDGSGGIDGLAGAADVIVSPDGAHVYVAGSGDDAVAVFSRNSLTGALSFVETYADGGTMTGLAGASGLAASPDGNFIYVTGPNDDSLEVFSRNADPSSPDFGKLTEVENHRDSTSEDGLAGASSVAISPDGAHVYVTGAADNALVVFSRNMSTGVLSYLEFHQDDSLGINGMEGARDVVVSADGSMVFVAAPGNNAIAAFSRVSDSSDADFGRLSFVDWFTSPSESETGAAARIDGLDATNSVSMSPNGDFLFSTGETTDKISSIAVWMVSAGARCPDPDNGVGDLDHQIRLPGLSYLEFDAYYRIKNDASGVIHNDASVAADAPTDFHDPDNSNDTDFDETEIGLEVDIEITKTADLASPVPGEVLGYTITVRNNGPQNIDGSLGHLRIRDVFPIYDGTTVGAGFESPGDISWTCSDDTGGHCIDAAGSGNIDAQVDLAAGGSVVFRTSGILHPWSLGTLENRATFLLPSQYVDSDSSNDDGLDSRAVSPVADLSIEKTHQPPSDDFNVDPGDTFHYTISIHNPGPSAVRNVQVQDIFPAALENTSWSCSASGSGSICHDATGSGNITTMLDLAPGGNGSLVVTTMVRSSAEGAILNSVTLAGGDASDPNLANNSDDDLITLNAHADLAITKDDGRMEAVPGRRLSYTITVSNRGTGPYRDDVFGARVEDLFPPELTHVSWTCDATPPIPGDLSFLQLNRLSGRLDGAADVLVSPDGAHVYAVGAAGDALVAWSRVREPGANFGKLSTTPIDIEERDISDPDPDQWILEDLDGPKALAISPDGRFLYVAASEGNAVLVFSRASVATDDHFGALSLVESLVDGAEGVDGLQGASDLLISPNGDFLYVAGAQDNALAVFSRNSGSGRLSFVEVLRDGIDGVDGLEGAGALVISPQGKHLYAAGSAEDKISWFERDPSTGELSFREVYVEGSDGVDGIAGVASLLLSPDGAQLYAAGPGDDAVSVFQRVHDDSSPSFGELNFDSLIDSGVAEGLSGVRSLALPRDLENPQDAGEHVLAGGDPSGKLVLLRRNVTTGLLSFQAVLREGQPITPPELTVSGLEVVTAIAASPDGRHVYTSSDGDDAVAVFDRQPPDPAFAFIEADVDGQDDGWGTRVSGLAAPRSVAVSGDGNHVYVAAFGSDSLAVFHRDPEMNATPDGRGKHLAFVATYAQGGEDASAQTIDGLSGPAALALSPDSRYLYVVSETESALSVFSRNATNGELDFVEMESDGVDDPDDGIGNPVDGLSGAVALALSPSGGSSSQVYVAGQYEASLAVFERNIADGRLSFLEKKTNGSEGVEGLDGISGIVVSPDGDHVYAVSRIDDAITVFRRDPADGSLSFLQSLKDSVDAEGLDGAMSVAISPDGAHVFVASSNDDALAIFARNRDEISDGYGQLSFVRAIVDGWDLDGISVDGLAGARSVAVGADGLRIFVGAEHDAALTVFGRVADDTSPDFGALNLIETRVDGVDGVEGLNQVYAVAVSLVDNSFVYAVGLGDNAVASFEARSGSSCTPSGLGDIDDEVNIGWGGEVRYTVDATVASWATGNLRNVARVYAPAGTFDPDLQDDPEPQPDDNNYALDEDLLTPKADLSLSKSDGALSATAGENLHYTIALDNYGPSDAVGARIVDTALAPGGVSPFDESSWSCVAIGSGYLNKLQMLSDGETQGSLTIDGLDGASALALSADGSSLYVTGLFENALAIFDRDSQTGELSFVRAIHNGDTLGSATVDGLGGAGDLVMIDDGTVESLYVTGQTDDSVAVFSRNPSDGSLSFLHAIRDGVGGADGLDQAVSVVVSDDGSNVYVAGANDDAIAVFQRQSNGSLVFVDKIDDAAYGLDGVSDLLLTPGPDSSLYATGFNSGTVDVFRRGADGSLSFVEKKGAGTSPYLGGATALAVDPDAHFLYVGASISGAVLVFSRSSADGSLQLRQELLSSTMGLSGLAGVSDLVISPDAAHLYAAGQSADAVVLFRRDPLDGKLSLVESFFDDVGGIDGLDGVAALALSSDGRQIYAAGMSDDSVTVFNRPSDSSCPANGSGGIDESVRVASGGRLVFSATARVASGSSGVSCPSPLDGSRNCVVNEVSVSPGSPPLFEDLETGNNSDSDADYLEKRADLKITKADQYTEYTGLQGAVAVALDPSLGRNLYLAGADDESIAIFSRNPSDGSLNFLEKLVDDENGVDGLGGVSDLALSSDGLHLYAAGPSDNAVAVFERDADTGLLSFLEVEINGMGSTAGILGARALALSPGQGRHLYVAGRDSDAISVFDVDLDESGSTFGEITYASLVQNGVDGVVDLDAPSDLVVTQQQVYASAFGSDALVVFERDDDPSSADFGSLSYLRSFIDGSDGVDGLKGPVALALSPSQETLFVLSQTSEAIAVFARNTSTGELSFLESLHQGDVRDGGGTIDGLVDARSLVVKEEGGDLLVDVTGKASGGTSSALSRFFWDAAAQHLSFQDILLDGDMAGSRIADDLDGAAGMAVDGNFLYLAAAEDDALSVFDASAAPDLLQVFENGGGGIGPGQSDPSKWVRYTITVENLGPSEVSDARVRDLFPAQFESISWSCSVQPADGGDSHTSCQSPSGSGDLEEDVDIAVGGKVIFSATGGLRPEVTGVLSNTATVTAPEGLIDPELGNNSDTDSDTLLEPHADLRIEKTRVGDPIPGLDLSYQITVSNDGPSFARANTVQDLLPEALVESTWICEASPPPGMLEATASSAVLSGASAAVLSSEGDFLYAVGSSGGEVLSFSRDPRSGALTLIQSLEDGVDGVDGVGGATALVLSPDDRTLYVAGETDDAVAVFERDGTTGELSLIQVQRDGIGLVNGLGGVRSLACAPDGRRLYAAGAADNAIAVFQRNSSSGELSFSELVQQGVDGVDGLSGVADLALSHDGSFLYAAGALADAVAVFACDPADGSLSFVESLKNGDLVDGNPIGGLGGASALVLSPDDAELYLAGETDDALVAFSRDLSTGRLHYSETFFNGSGGVVDGLDGVSDLVLSPDGAQVYAAGALSAAVAVFARNEEGGLSFLRAFDSADGISGLGGVRNLLPSEDGKHLYAAAQSDDQIILMNRLMGSTCSARGSGDISDSVDLVPGGTAIYTLTGHVSAGATGSLVNTARVSPGPGVIDPNESNNVSTTSDNGMTPQADLQISKNDGLLSVNAGEDLSYTIRVVNNGPSDVYGAELSDVLPIFPATEAGLEEGSVDWSCIADSALSLEDVFVNGIDGIDGLDGAVQVVLSPDPDGPGGESGARFVYVTGSTAGALSTFGRDPSTGVYEEIQLLHEGDMADGVTINGLAGAAGLAISPDGAHLYVAGSDDDAISVFEIESDENAPDFGSLHFLEYFSDSNPIPGLGGAVAVAVSPDGANVYVAASDSDAVMVYDRDPSTGMLSYVQRKKEGSDDVPLQVLDGVRDVLLSPDGAQLYAAAQNADAVAVFERNRSTGTLSFLQVIHNLEIQGTQTVNGLDFVRALTISPGGVSLYAASLADDAVVLFERNTDESSDDFGRLSFRAAYRNGVDGFEGLDGATALSLSPDGVSLYVAGLNDDAVALLRRDWNDGSLSPVEVIRDATPGVDSLDGACGLAVLPDNSGVFVAAKGDDSLSLISRRAKGECAASGVPDAGGEIHETIDLAAGASASFEIHGTVDPGARGTLMNAAGVVSPLEDPNMGDNVAADNDTEILIRSDLGVTMSDGMETVIAGLPLSYSIVVSNAGPALAYGATLHDVLPSNLLACTCSRSDGAACAVNGSNVLNEVIDIEPGASIEYVLDCVLDPSTGVPLTNTAAVAAAAPGEDTNPENDVATDSDSVVAVSDLSITKSNGIDEVVPGRPLSYLIGIDNLGPSSLSLGRVVDTVPAQLLNPSWSCVASGGAGCTAGPVSGDILDEVSIPAGASVLYTLQGDVDPAAQGSLVNTASVQILIDDGTPGVSPSDPDSTNNVATDVDTLTPVADIAIAKTDDVDPVVTGHPLNYSITVSNSAGPSDAHDTVVTENLPAGVSLVSTSGCAEDPAGIPNCTIGEIPRGATANISVAVNVDEGTLGTITNAASVQTSSADPNPVDNTTTEETTVEPWANLSVRKVDASDPVVAGTELSYTITVTNPGPYDAENVVVSDSMPSGVSFVSSSGCAEDPVGLPDCSLGTIGAGQSKAYGITVRVDSSTIGRITNDVEVVSSWFDPDLSDNSAFEDTDIVAESDLQITKTNGVSFVYPGEDLLYTMVLTNAGPSDAPAVDVSDLIPPELISVEWSCTPTGAAFCSDGVGNVLTDTADVPAGEQISYSVNCAVDPSLDPGISSLIENTVDIALASPGSDPVPSNNSATDSDPLLGGDPVFSDGFESGDTLFWSGAVGLSKDLEPAGMALPAGEAGTVRE